MVDEVFDDGPTRWRAMCMAWPSENQDLAVYFYNSTVLRIELAEKVLMPQVADYTQGTAEFPL